VVTLKFLTIHKYSAYVSIVGATGYPLGIFH